MKNFIIKYFDKISIVYFLSPLSMDDVKSAVDEILHLIYIKPEKAHHRMTAISFKMHNKAIVRISKAAFILHSAFETAHRGWR